MECTRQEGEGLCLVCWFVMRKKRSRFGKIWKMDITTTWISEQHGYQETKTRMLTNDGKKHADLKGREAITRPQRF